MLQKEKIPFQMSGPAYWIEPTLKTVLCINSQMWTSQEDLRGCVWSHYCEQVLSDLYMMGAGLSTHCSFRIMVIPPMQTGMFLWLSLFLPSPSSGLHVLAVEILSSLMGSSGVWILSPIALRVHEKYQLSEKWFMHKQLQWWEARCQMLGTLEELFDIRLQPSLHL